MSVVTPEELKRYMSGINMSVPQMASAQDVIDGVQEELEMYINRKIDFSLIREVVTLDSSGVANTSYSPITKVDQAVFVPSYEYGMQIIDTLYTNDARESLNLPPLPTSAEVPSYDLVSQDYAQYDVIPGGVRFNPHTTGSVVLTYWAGGGPFFAPHMKAIRLAVLRVASREFQQMNDDTMSLRNGSAAPPVDPIPVPRRGWDLEELRRFDRIRRRVIA